MFEIKMKNGSEVCHLFSRVFVEIKLMLCTSLYIIISCMITLAL